jgi:hypothetical protein
MRVSPSLTRTTHPILRGVPPGRSEWRRMTGLGAVPPVTAAPDPPGDNCVLAWDDAVQTCAGTA